MKSSFKVLLKMQLKWNTQSKSTLDEPLPHFRVLTFIANLSMYFFKILSGIDILSSMQLPLGGHYMTFLKITHGWDNGLVPSDPCWANPTKSYIASPWVNELRNSIAGRIQLLFETLYNAHQRQQTRLSIRTMNETHHHTTFYFYSPVPLLQSKVPRHCTKCQMTMH